MEFLLPKEFEALCQENMGPRKEAETLCQEDVTSCKEVEALCQEDGHCNPGCMITG